MLKYLYLFGLVFSFLTFMVGFNNYNEHEVFSVFNLGMMSLTPIISFILTTIYLKNIPEDEEEIL